MCARTPRNCTRGIVRGANSFFISSESHGHVQTSGRPTSPADKTALCLPRVLRVSPGPRLTRFAAAIHGLTTSHSARSGEARHYDTADDDRSHKTLGTFYKAFYTPIRAGHTTDRSRPPCSVVSNVVLHGPCTETVRGIDRGAPNKQRKITTPSPGGL